MATAFRDDDDDLVQMTLVICEDIESQLDQAGIPRGDFEWETNGGQVFASTSLCRADDRSEPPHDYGDLWCTLMPAPFGGPTGVTVTGACCPLVVCLSLILPSERAIYRFVVPDTRETKNAVRELIKEAEDGVTSVSFGVNGPIPRD